MLVGQLFRIKGISVRQDLGLLLKIDFGVDVSRVDRDVPQPGAYGVDIDSGAEQMRGSSVTDSVGADLLLLHLGHGRRRSSCVAGDDVMHSEACHRLGRAAQEHALVILPPACKLTQCEYGGSPQWTEADFISFALQTHRG